MGEERQRQGMVKKMVGGVDMEDVEEDMEGNMEENTWMRTWRGTYRRKWRKSWKDMDDVEKGMKKDVEKEDMQSW